MKNQKVIATFSEVIMISLSLLTTAIAQTRMPGVAVGESFKYTFSFDMNVSNSTFMLPSLFEGLLAEVRNIDSVQVTVTQISGSTVTMQTIVQFKNGTQQSSTGSIDVSNGQDATQEGSIATFLIAANLKPGEQIYLGHQGTINETVTKSYPSGTREVNHQNIILEYNVSQEELSGFGITIPLQQSNTQDTYWDKQTGALVEMSYNTVTRSSEINADISLRVALVESSVFTVPEYPKALGVAVLLIVVSAIAIITLRHRSASDRNLTPLS